MRGVPKSSLAALLSLLLWFGILTAGRAIKYVPAPAWPSFPIMLSPTLSPLRARVGFNALRQSPFVAALPPDRLAHGRLQSSPMRIGLEAH
jgi:hypothetical protein